MSNQVNKKTVTVVAGAMAFACLLTIAGIYAGFKIADSRQPFASQFPTLHADSASAGDGMSFATGWVDDGVEGLFVLDHLTGDLQCWVVNRRNGAIGGVFRASVGADMGADKIGDADLVMTTGRIDFTGAARRGNERPAQCICYVGDGNTGKVLGYSFRINAPAIAQGNVVEGKLEVITKGVTRDGGQVRDQ